ncbi:10472_t:CDS:1, partial [Racocetra fulgida]
MSTHSGDLIDGTKKKAEIINDSSEFVTKEEEKRLVKKLDLRLIPL